MSVSSLDERLTKLISVIFKTGRITFLVYWCNHPFTLAFRRLFFFADLYYQSENNGK